MRYGNHASCTRITVILHTYDLQTVHSARFYELFIEYSSQLYRICKGTKTVDNSEKTDVPRLKLWITVWMVWKCTRLYTHCERNEYSRMEG